VDTLILDLLDPEEARTPPMAMKDYSDEFKADAVALYESTPGATYKDIAADLGINRATLREWVLRDRDRRGIAPTDARRGGTAPTQAGRSPASDDPDERIRQLEARVAELEASERKLATERDILRKAAKYFAGETNW
jgi:transposase